MCAARAHAAPERSVLDVAGMLTFQLCRVNEAHWREANASMVPVASLYPSPDSTRQPKYVNRDRNQAKRGFRLVPLTSGSVPTNSRVIRCGNERSDVGPAIQAAPTFLTNRRMSSMAA